MKSFCLELIVINIRMAKENINCKKFSSVSMSMHV